MGYCQGLNFVAALFIMYCNDQVRIFWREIKGEMWVGSIYDNVQLDGRLWNEGALCESSEFEKTFVCFGRADKDFLSKSLEAFCKRNQILNENIYIEKGQDRDWFVLFWSKVVLDVVYDNTAMENCCENIWYFLVGEISDYLSGLFGDYKDQEKEDL